MIFLIGLEFLGFVFMLGRAWERAAAQKRELDQGPAEAGRGVRWSRPALANVR